MRPRQVRYQTALRPDIYQPFYFRLLIVSLPSTAEIPGRLNIGCGFKSNYNSKPQGGHPRLGPVSPLLLFTANDCLAIGIAPDREVSLDDSNRCRLDSSARSTRYGWSMRSKIGGPGGL